MKFLFASVLCDIVLKLFPQNLYVSSMSFHNIKPLIIKPHLASIVSHNKEVWIEDIFILFFKLIARLPCKKANEFSFICWQLLKSISKNFSIFWLFNDFQINYKKTAGRLAYNPINVGNTTFQREIVSSMHRLN